MDLSSSTVSKAIWKAREEWEQIICYNFEFVFFFLLIHEVNSYSSFKTQLKQPLGCETFPDHPERVPHFSHSVYCIHHTIRLFMYLSPPVASVTLKDRIQVLIIISPVPNIALGIHEGLSKYLLIRHRMNHTQKRNIKLNNPMNYCQSF